MNLLQIIENIVNILDPLMVLIAIFCWAMGGFMYIKALLQAKARSELGPGQPGGWGAPFATFVTGTVFFAMPEFISILNVSIFDQQSVSANAIFALAPETIGKISTSSGATEKMIAGIVAIIQFVGVIGIMARGLFAEPIRAGRVREHRHSGLALPF